MNEETPSTNEEKKLLELLDRITARSKERYEHRLALLKEKRIVDGKEEWNVYNSGVREHFERGGHWTTFNGIGGYTEQSIKDEMEKRRNALHAAGKKLLVVEHFGQGRVGTELEADKVIVSGLTQFSGAPANVEQVVGDALDDASEKEMEEKIRSAQANGYSLQLVIFRPVGGLSLNSQNVYAFRKLYAQLRTAYELLDEDGLMFVGAFGSNLEMTLLQDMFKATGYQRLLLDKSGKDAIGIRKRSSVGTELPTEIEWARKHKLLFRILLGLDVHDAQSLMQPRPRIGR